MQLDLHIHTNRYSGCSNIDPQQSLVKARSVGLDGIALTEHGIRWKDDDIDELKDKSGIKDLLVIPGQEVACFSKLGHFQGEFLVFGYPVSLGGNKSIDQLIEMVQSEGGIVIAAHPFKRRETGVGFYGSGYSTFDLNLDGLEIEHTSYDRKARHLAYAVMKQKQITGIGSSDAHDLEEIGTIRTILKKKIQNVSELCEEIRSGCVQVVNTKNRRIQLEKNGNAINV